MWRILRDAEFTPSDWRIDQKIGSIRRALAAASRSVVLGERGCASAIFRENRYEGAARTRGTRRSSSRVSPASRDWRGARARVAKGERSAVSIAAERAATSREACLVSAIFSCRPAAGAT